MIFCTPFNSKSPHPYADLADAIQKKGLNLHHIHLVVSSEADEDAAFKYGSRLTEHFRKTLFCRLATLDRKGADLPNHLFRAAVRYMQKYKPEADELPNPAMLYGDPGFLPNTKDWLDRVQTAYHVMQSKPVFASVKMDANGDPIFQGPLVVGKEFAERSALLDFLRHDKHWRDTLRWELGKEYQASDLFVGQKAVFKQLR